MKQCFSMQRSMYLIVMVCILLLTGACATSTGSDNSIEKRVMARWDTYLSGDLAGTYEYLSPAYRSSVGSLDYQRSLLQMKVTWRGARYIESECTETICKVTVLIDYTLYGVLPGVKSFEGSQEIDESWIKDQGIWYLVPKE